MIRDGFIRVAASTPEVKVADVEYNREQVCEQIEEGRKKGASIMVFPELVLTGYTCGELFIQKSLLAKAKEELRKLIAFTAGDSMLVFVGLPWEYNNKLYNVAAAIQDGKLLGLVPKRWIPNYSEFYEARHFTPGIKNSQTIFNGKPVPIGTNYIFNCKNMPEFIFGIEICEDLWVTDSPSIMLAKEGANIIVNLSASNDIIGKSDYRRIIVKAQSGSLLCTYMYANAGIGESTTDMVYSGHSIISENGALSVESERFSNGIIIFDTDLQKIESERKRSNTFQKSSLMENEKYIKIPFDIKMHDVQINNKISPTPFVPLSVEDIHSRCKEISAMQSIGLAKRIKHTNCNNAIIGLSGGLDSTLALIVTVNAFKHLNLNPKDIIAVTMPCFGTTDRTYSNACKLAEQYGATLKEINIRNSVIQHFSDIGHDINNHDVTYENSQARERTQILMDIANQNNGLVIGTGDLSELALGWSTYNGDHMSMYAVNASIPKTLVRYLVKYEADCSENELKNTLYDILDTPVSPELLPPDENGIISQKTEDLVGPYELHDFFLYYMVRFGFSPEKIFRIALLAFKGQYDENTILKWEKIFYKRFFSQQFKRSCLPDGPKIGSVALSPRSDFRMPSDASVNVWLSELENIN